MNSAASLLPYVLSTIRWGIGNLHIFLIRVAYVSWFAGKVVLEAVILTAVVVVSLTLYTFLAAKRGYDFNFLGPFLFGAVLVLLVFALIQVCKSLHYILIS